MKIRKTLALAAAGGLLLLPPLAYDYGVNYMREFLKAPFFFRSESEQLYILLDSDLGIRSAALERFSCSNAHFLPPGFPIEKKTIEPQFLKSDCSSGHRL